MRIESPAFQAGDVEGFLAELEEEDRLALIERLRRVSARLAELGSRVQPAAGEASWSAHEVLAHVAVLSKFYGTLTYRIGRGELTELDLVGSVGLRDVFGEQTAQLPPAEVLEAALADHRRTIAYLESATAADLRRKARLGHGGEMSAGQVARVALCAHLEQHVRQLEAALS